MKKYTKRIIAYVLAAVMVLTGLPMNAKEVKAADASVIELDFASPTTGVISSVADDMGENETIGIDPTAYYSDNTSRTFTITSSFQGSNWRLNTDRTVPALEEGATSYSTGNTGFKIFKWAKTKNNLDTSVYRAVFYIFGNETLAADFDVTADQAGQYTMEIEYYDASDPRALTIDVNAGTDNAFTTQFTAAEVANGKTMAIEYLAGTVTLVEGTNTIDIINTQTKAANETCFRAIRFTKVVEPEYASATLNLADGAQLNVGDTYDLAVEAVLDDGNAITDGLSVVYTSSNTDVATVTDNVLSVVGVGETTVSAAVSYNGELKETLTANITTAVKGAFNISFTNIDATTLATDGESRYYFATTTKPAEGTGETWSINVDETHKDSLYDINAGTAARVFIENGAPAYLRLMSKDKTIAIDFTAPQTDKYDISADLKLGSNMGYADVLIDDVYVGSFDGYSDNAATQNLLSVDLTEGTHTLKMYAKGVSSGSSYYFTLYSLSFTPTTGEGRALTGVTTAIDTDTFDMAEAATAQITTTVATTNDDVIYLPKYASNDNGVATVTWKGVVTPKAKGNTNITVTAGEFTETIPVTVNDSRTYTITWVDEDGTELGTSTVGHGNVPEYTGETPVKAGDAQYTYTFAGWDVEPVAATEDVTYTATYEATVNEYKVTWLNEDGTVLAEDMVAYGETPVYAGETPVKEGNAQYTYTFAGWDVEPVAVTGDVTYTATYTYETNGYNITWIVNGEETTEVVASGTTPVAPEVEGYEDTYYTYEFTGWSPEITEVTGEATYEATFAKVAKAYAEAVTARTDSYGEVTVSEDGKTVTLDVTGSVPYTKNPEGVWANWIGLDVTAPEGVDAANVTVKRHDGTTTTLEAALDTETTGSFYVAAIPTTTVLVRPYQIDWNSDGNYDLTFVYDLTNATLLVKEFTVTWVANGVETTETYLAGTMPVAPSVGGYADEQYTYTFAGWDKEIAAAEADVTYTAVYTETTNKYAVTWKNHDGSELATEYVEYGTVPAYEGTPVYKEYAFLGWDSEVVAVTGDVTYTAVYDIDGIDEGYYYVDGVLQSENAQLIKIGEDLYYVQHSGAIKKNGNQTISSIRTNGYVEAGTYYFNEDGIMQNPADDLKGEIGEDGYYYVNGEVRKNVGLVQIDGYYYYVQYSGKVKVSGNQTVAEDKLNGYAVEAGTYYFFADGVMETDEVRMNGSVVDGKYYVKGEVRKNVGLVELANGDFVFVQYSGNVKQSGFQTIKEATCNGHTEYIGVQKFVDGVMVK